MASRKADAVLKGISTLALANDMLTETACWGCRGVGQYIAKHELLLRARFFHKMQQSPALTLVKSVLKRVWHTCTYIIPTFLPTYLHALMHTYIYTCVVVMPLAYSTLVGVQGSKLVNCFTRLRVCSNQHATFPTAIEMRGYSTQLRSCTGDRCQIVERLLLLMQLLPLLLLRIKSAATADVAATATAAASTTTTAAATTTCSPILLDKAFPRWEQGSLTRVPQPQT